MPTAEPTIILCASAPIGDGPYALPSYVYDLLSSFEAAAAQSGVTAWVHIFVDGEVHGDLRKMIDGRKDSHLRVETYEPPTSPNTPSPTPGSDFASPWLEWIAGRLGHEAIDIVHFISPGHYNGEHGAIVLAGRPDANIRHGDVIGAAELALFYDRLGCQVMGFSSPSMPQWVAGQRALAFELSWLRPGPILLSEYSVQPDSALGLAYRRLLGSKEPLKPKLAAVEPIHLCLHPELVRPEDDTFTIVPIMDDKESFDTLNLSSKAARIADLYVSNRRASLSETRDLSPTESWGRDGAMEGLDFLSDLISRRGS